MTESQREFWHAVREFASGFRRSKRVDLEVAADALALEQEIEARLEADAPAAMVAEEPKGGR